MPGAAGKRGQTKMASEIEIADATQADIAADMEHHRATYGRFFALLKYSIIGLAIIVAFLIILYS